jgi:hypothetical protein
VTGLILVPVLAALAAFSAITTFQDTARRSDGFEYPDGATLRVSSQQVAVNGAEDQDLRHPSEVRALGLPDGVRTEVAWTGADWFHGDRKRPDGRGPLLAGAELREVEPRSAAAATFVVDHGRLPRTADEIFLTKPLARLGGWSVGDEVTSAKSARPFRVVGTGVLGQDTERRAAALTGLPDAFWTQPMDGIDGIDTGDGYAQIDVGTQVLTAWVDDPVLRRHLHGAFFDGPSSGADLDRRLGAGLTMTAAALCAVVAVVASAAFAISSRRQLRSIGLLSTMGTDPGTIRRAMLLQGAIPGLVAGGLAIAVAAVAATVANAAEVPERIAAVSGATASVSVGGAVVVVGLGLASGIAAAWQPARTASRVPTLAALAGRRPLGPVPTRVPIGGLALWIGGVIALLLGFGTDHRGALERLQPFLIIGGIAAIALGGVGLAPVVVALLDPLATRVRGTWRMGLRGLARHRMQSAATVAAIGVVLAIPVGLLTTRNGLEARQPEVAEGCCVAEEPPETIAPRPAVEVLRNPQRGAQVRVSGALRSSAAPGAVDEVVAVLGPDAATIRSLPLVDQRGTWTNVAVIDEDAAASVLEPWAARAIAAGRAVAFDGGADQVAFTAAGDTASFEVTHSDQEASGRHLPISASYLVGADALGDVGAQRPPDAIIVLRDMPLTDGELHGLQALSGYDGIDAGRPVSPTLDEVRAAVGGGAEVGRSAIAISIVNGYPAGLDEPAYDDRTPRDEWATSLLVGAIVALALALLVLTITLSLRAVDGEADRRAAVAAGVAPAALRRQRAFEGGVLALLGAALAIPLGWLPVVAARLGGLEDPPLRQVLALPGREAVPVLLAPAVAAIVLWTVLPALAAGIRRLRHREVPDDLLPRW